MQDDFYKEILDHLQDGVYFVDRDRRITYWNKGAEQITGYSAAQVVGRHCADNILVHVNDQGVQLCKAGCPLSEVIKDGMSRETSVFLHHADGHRVPVRVCAVPIKSESGIIGAVETFSDNSAALSVLERINELQKVATVDAVTQLGNRYGTEIELQSCLRTFKQVGAPFGILFMDIDTFKSINDEHGHDVGDKILAMVARTLGRNIRSYNHVGRWGGDEFLVILTNANRARLEAVANTLRMLVEHSFLIMGEDKLQVTISIGGAVVEEVDTVETLLHRADVHLYESKAAGRNRVTI